MYNCTFLFCPTKTVTYQGTSPLKRKKTIMEKTEGTLRNERGTRNGSMEFSFVMALPKLWYQFVRLCAPPTVTYYTLR